MSIYEWPGNTGPVSGWRWESVDTVPDPKHRNAQFETCGDDTTLGPSMSSFPHPGQWSADASCYIDSTRTELRHTDAPARDCVCGYRVCRTIDTALAYLLSGEELRYRTNPAGLVLIRVETEGRLVANDYTRNLGPWNCVSAQRIRPLWPAFVTNEAAAELLRGHYGTDQVQRLGSWAEINLVRR